MATKFEEFEKAFRGVKLVAGKKCIGIELVFRDEDDGETARIKLTREGFSDAFDDEDDEP